MKEEFKSFYNRFNKKESHEPESESGVKSFETKYHIEFPNDFREFIIQFGDLWTPGIINLIVDNDLELNDVQDFWKIERIEFDKENEWTSQLETDLIPFASDSLGNIFGFKTEELKNLKNSSKIYFFDHDFDTIEAVSHSFTDWINEFLKIKD